MTLINTKYDLDSRWKVLVFSNSPKVHFWEAGELCWTALLILKELKNTASWRNAKKADCIYIYESQGNV